MNAASTSTRPAESAAGSSGAIGKGLVAAFAEIRIGWNAVGSTALGGCGLREPAMPGSATRASAAVSAAPATKRVGRTIRARYDVSDCHATVRAPADHGRPRHASANEDEVSRRALDLAELIGRQARTSTPPPFLLSAGWLPGGLRPSSS
jgi:hypothetical protein